MQRSRTQGQPILQRINNEERENEKERKIPKDELALKFVDQYVYVWKGRRKGRIGLVKAIGGEKAQVEFAGGGAGCTIETLQRENPITFVIKIKIKRRRY